MRGNLSPSCISDSFGSSSVHTISRTISLLRFSPTSGGRRAGHRRSEEEEEEEEEAGLWSVLSGEVEQPLAQQGVVLLQVCGEFRGLNADGDTLMDGQMDRRTEGTL
ncbi:hypothetical protein EYF80_000218 [Liparis tanakae]|uniref:Uncharacterized protein n=1 Tax=Liparis tanakae TaxID=230148 RepID=A0A4Z2JH69_9TELE|nr:hypothetical protein EYF80_000218 [Liparis tanakae]